MKAILTFVCFFLLFLTPVFSFAGIDLPWSTTFNCADCVQPSSCSCDGVTDGPSWSYYCNPAGAPSLTSPNSYLAGITAAANNPAGDGGKGASFWVGDGSNNNSGTLAITFNKAGGESEVYIRWYFQYPLGFAWSSPTYDKWLYIHTDQGTDAIPEPDGWDPIRIYAQGTGDQGYSSTGGWDTIMVNGELSGGHRKSDGVWHWAEVHLKMDTNHINGICEMWVDGILKFSKTNMDYGSKTGFTWLHFKSNQATPNNGGCVAVYYDDMAIAATGPIGELGSKPNPPMGLKIVQ